LPGPTGRIDHSGHRMRAAASSAAGVMLMRASPLLVTS
jgi:hypothetical protein